MKKKIYYIVVTIILFIAIFLLFIQSMTRRHKSFDWNYSGTAVVLSNQKPYELKGKTDIILNGIVYENGNFFLGDLRIGIIERLRHYKGNKNSEYYNMTGVMTLYRYLLLKEGKDYFNNTKNRDICIVKSESAWLDNVESKARKIKMFLFYWFEWYEYANQEGNIKRAPWMYNGGLYFIEPGKYFMVRTETEFIVPGVTTQEEAINFIENYFEELIK